MKKFLIFAVLISLSFWGCSENSDVVGPADMQQQEFLKVSNGPVSELTAEAKSALEIESINTLSKIGLPIEKSKVIGEDGGSVRFLLGDAGVLAVGNVKVAADELENGSVVKVTIVSEKAALDLLPDAEFNTDSELTVGFVGVDVNAGDVVDFVYFDNGVEKVIDNHSGILVGNGWVVIIKAKLGHFSRYGFTKRTDD